MKRWAIAAMIGGALLAAGLIGAAIQSLRAVQATMEDIYVPVQRSAASDFGLERVPAPDFTGEAADTQKEGEDSLVREQPMEGGIPFSVLVIGVDERKKDRGRSDTLMVLAVNPDRESTLMFNIPRDTRTTIPGYGTDKINHAYAYGGVETTIKTVEQFLNAPIDYYVLENMEGFSRLVDTFGGVTVDNAFAFEYEGRSFPKGALRLNGDDALKFSRMRYDDPRGDFGRNERQRLIVKALIAEAVEVDSLLKINEIMERIAETVQTNISFDEAKRLVSACRNACRRIETMELRGRGRLIDGIYYFEAGEDERNRLRERFIEQIGLRDASVPSAGYPTK